MIHLSALAAAILAVPAIARQAPPEYQPYCAMPGAKPLFLSPMGEPFRAEPGQAYPSASWFAAADRDHDGAIDRVEFIRDADRFFKRIDTDHDARLTPEEIDHYERVMAPEIALWGLRGPAFDPSSRDKPRNGESGYGGPMGAGRYAWLNIPQPVASADLDVNRVVDQKEFASAAGRRFDRLAPDGRLVLAGQPKTPQQMALEGPCTKRPQPKKGRDGRPRDDREDDAPDDRGGGTPPRGGMR